MRKKYLSALLFGALLFASASTFTSCKDYDDDIQNLTERVDAVETLVDNLQSQIQSGAVITDVASTGNGVVVTLSNGNSFTLTNGTNGTNGSVVEIGENGNWFIDGEDTGRPSQGAAGTGSDAPTIYYEPGTEGTEEGYWVKVTEENGQTTRETTTIAWLPEGAVTAVWNTNTQELIMSNVLDANGELTTVIIPLASELKSLVFDVDHENAIYMDGVESMEYRWIPYRAITINNTATTGTINNNSYTVLEDNNNYQNLATNATFIEPWLTYAYHMNPTSAIINDDVTVSLISEDKDFVTTRASEATPEVKFSTTKVADGIMYVDIRMAGCDVMNQAWNSEQSNSIDDTAEGYFEVTNNNDKITSLALQANLNKDGSADTIVTSDYAGVYSSQIKIKALAYQENNSDLNYTMDATQHSVPNVSNGSHLYYQVKDAVENAPTVKVAYNNIQGVNLNNLVATHWSSNSGSSFGKKGEEQIWNTSEELSQYNLAYNFELVTLTIGSNETSESNNCQLRTEGGATYLRPCGVNADSGEPSGVQGIETVGRTPLVRAELINTENNEIVAIGYIKFLIVEDIMPKWTSDFDIQDLYYSCAEQDDQLTWAETQTELLGLTAQTSKETFDALYQLDVDASGNAKQFVRSGAAGAYTFEEATSSEILGTIEEIVDPEHPTTTCLQWTVDQADFIQFRPANAYETTVVRCVRYVGKIGGNTSDTKQPIYVPISVTLHYPQGILNNKINEYWYAENSLNNGTHEIHLNVEVPGTESNPGTTANADCEFVNDFDYVFQVNETLGHGNWSTTPWSAGSIVYNENAPTFGVASNFADFQDDKLAYIYYFSAENNGKQVTGNSGTEYTLVVANTTPADYDQVYQATGVEYNNTALYANTIATNNLIAVIDQETGKVTYQDTYVAKDILNYVSHADLENTFTANIGVAAFNECSNLLPLANDKFDALFLRPVDVEGGERDYFVDGVDADEPEAWAYVLDLVRLEDWRDRAFVSDHLDYFHYYEVENISIDTDQIRTNLNNPNLTDESQAATWPLLNSISTAVGFTYNGQTSTPSVPAANASLSDLRTHYGTLHYWNNTANVQEFKVYIPVKVSYKWGDIDTYVICTVQRTTQN